MISLIQNTRKGKTNIQWKKADQWLPGFELGVGWRLTRQGHKGIFWDDGKDLS